MTVRSWIRLCLDWYSRSRFHRSRILLSNCAFACNAGQDCGFQFSSFQWKIALRIIVNTKGKESGKNEPSWFPLWFLAPPLPLSAHVGSSVAVPPDIPWWSWPGWPFPGHLPTRTMRMRTTRCWSCRWTLSTLPRSLVKRLDHGEVESSETRVVSLWENGESFDLQQLLVKRFLIWNDNNLCVLWCFCHLSSSFSAGFQFLPFSILIIKSVYAVNPSLHKAPCLRAAPKSWCQWSFHVVSHVFTVNQHEVTKEPMGKHRNHGSQYGTTPISRGIQWMAVCFDIAWCIFTTMIWLILFHSYKAISKTLGMKVSAASHHPRVFPLDAFLSVWH